MMLRWLSPSMSLGKACGLISTSVVAPSRASASAATCARPRAMVVFPVPGGPASTIRPCGRAARIPRLGPGFRVGKRGGHCPLAAVLQREQRLPEQALLHFARAHDRVPVAVVMLRRQDVHR